MSVWPQTLFGRNLVLLAGTTVLSVILSFASLYILILNAQIDRFTSIGAEMINTMSGVASDLEPDDLDTLLSRMGESEYLRIMPLGEVPEIGNHRESRIERVLMQRLIDNLDYQDEMEWRVGANRTLWLNVRIGEHYYWVAAESGTTWTPFRWLILVMCVIIVAMTAIGALATRQIAKPLAALTRETDNLSLGRDWQMTEIVGPSEITNLARSFERMTARLKQAEAIRAETLAELSHDLRTPLARLRLAVEMMKDDDDLKSSAVRQVEQVDRLIEQFMDFARDGRKEPKTDFSLSDLIADIANAFGVDADIPAGIALTGQRELIGRAINNLVENAQKYGEPPVRLGLRQTNYHAVIEVSDGGAGFDPDQAADLLAPFVRGAHDAHIAGSGLGLTIASRVAADHDGEITFKRLDEGGFVAKLTLALKT